MRLSAEGGCVSPRVYLEWAQGSDSLGRGMLAPDTASNARSQIAWDMASTGYSAACKHSTKCSTRVRR
eukprot:748192-Rhodomonas_salina.4